MNDIAECRRRNLAKRALPSRINDFLNNMTCDGWVMNRTDLIELLEDARDEVVSSRWKTSVEVGFTFEPTRERVRLFSPDHRSLEIVAKNPSILEIFTALSVPLDFDDSSGLKDTKDVL